MHVGTLLQTGATMGMLYSISKRLIHATVPAPVKAWLFSKSNPLSGGLVRAKMALQKRAAHDEIYDARYYVEVEEGMRSSSEVIADAVVSLLRPSTAIDVGCGTGALMVALQERGV